MDYSQYPVNVVEDIVRLRRRIEASGLPAKKVDENLLIGTWNIRAFGGVFKEWSENSGSPKRNLRGMAVIAEIVRNFDVCAIQEVKRETTAIRMLQEDFLGPNWGLILSDVTAGDKGNSERLAYLYDRRRVMPSGLAGEIVLPPTEEGDPVEQFDRTPYMVGFESEEQSFALLTVHIRYGEEASDRLPELSALAGYVAEEIKKRAKADKEITNLIALGDFNIDKRGENRLFQALISSGLMVPQELMGLKTTAGSEAKYYDQIAWFEGEMNMLYAKKAGVIDFTDAVFQEMSATQKSYRVSDHFPLWAEFVIDKSTRQMAERLGLDPAMPEPLRTVPD